MSRAHLATLAALALKLAPFRGRTLFETQYEQSPSCYACRFGTKACPFSGQNPV
ncbi:hypothetical protein [Sulfurimonas sp.]|uniref:hypothetical protein n=1 Tax=Sulfurimonas sp. TaxID=2022749 RepID=UPI002A363C7C|nr:hypothetical protein [Sulfurimonas sp.]MDY0122890.1 hypothetical protein [Sulfurimonas sp.]